MLLCLVSMYCFLIQLCFTLQFKLWIGPLLCLRGVVALFMCHHPVLFLLLVYICFFFTHHPWTVSQILCSNFFPSDAQILSTLFMTNLSQHLKFIYSSVTGRRSSQALSWFSPLFDYFLWKVHKTTSANSLKEILKNHHLIFKLCTTVPSTFSL